MRCTVIRGLDDDVYFTLYGVEHVCAIMEIGKCLSPLVFEAYLTGKELLEVLNLQEELACQIKPENNYKVTAFDD